MSLESQVADLVASSNNLIAYFNTKKTAIDQAVAAAIAAVPEMVRGWYVDQVAGLDTNLGNLASPFKTFDKAIKSTPPGGVCQINLLSDYTLDVAYLSTCSYLSIVGIGAVAPKLRLKYFIVTPDTTPTRQLGGFLFQSQNSNFEMRNVTLVLPTTVGVPAGAGDQRLSSFLRTNGASNLPPLLSVSLGGMTVEMDPSFYGALIGTSTSSVCLCASGVTFPSGFGGKYLSAVASGVDPKTLPNVLTNLSTL